MTRKSVTDNGHVIETFGLSGEQHEIAHNMVNNDTDSFDCYTLELADKDAVDSWIDDARREGNEDYERFLSGAKELKLSIYTLNDHVGEFSQELGEVVVSYKN